MPSQRLVDVETVASSELVSFRCYGGEVSVHSHDHHQIVLPHLGRMEIEVGSAAGAVASGSGAFIAAGTTHTFVAAADGRFIVVDLPLASSTAVLASVRRGGDAFFPIAAPIRGLLDHFAGASDRGGLSADGYAAWSLLLLEEIVRGRGKPPDPDEVALRRALDVLRAHAARRIRTQEIAAMTGLSRTRLHVLFRERLGTSPHALLVDLRLRTARRLLEATALPIAEIAIRCGFADQNGLTRWCRRSLGLTPAAIRRNAREGSA